MKSAMGTMDRSVFGATGAAGARRVSGLGPSGPQAERTSKWLNPGKELKASTQREALIVEGVAEKRLYEQEMARLRTELEFCHDNIQRLSKELKLYELKYPHAGARISEAEVEGGADLPPWITSSEVMAPLLAAYDGRIHDLENTVVNQKSQLQAVTDRTEKLVEENNRLRETQIRDLDQLVQQAEASGGLGGVGAKEMVEELNERINILMTENALMSDQSSAIAKELDKTHHELEERDMQAASLKQSFNEMARTVKTLEDEVPKLNMEKQTAEAELMRTVNRLTDTERMVASAREEVARLQESKKLLEGQLNDANKTIASLQRRMEAEADGVSDRLRHSAARVSELQGALAAKSQDLEMCNEQLRRLTRDLESTRGDAAGMLQVMSGMEKQLADLAYREESTMQLAKESKQKIEDALLARDQARALEVQSRRELARVMEARKHDAQSRIREQEEAMSVLKAKLKAQVDSRERDIKDLMSENARLRNEHDRAVRDKTSLENMYSKLKHSLSEEQSSLKARFDDLQAKVVHADSLRAEEQKAKGDAMAEWEASVQQLNVKQETWKLREASLENMLKAREHELETVRAALRAATDRADAKEREMFKAGVAMEQLRSELARQMEELALTRDVEIQKLKLNMASLEGKARDAEKKLQDTESALTKGMQNAKLTLQRELAETQRALREESDMAQRYSQRNNDLHNRVTYLSAERNELALAAAGKTEEVAQLQSTLEESHRQVEEMRKQLVETLQQQEAKVREDARAKAELKRLQLDLARVQRDRTHSFSAQGNAGVQIQSRRASALSPSPYTSRRLS